MMVSLLPYANINDIATLATAATFLTAAIFSPDKALPVGGMVATAGAVALVANIGFAAAFSSVNIVSGIIACYFTAYVMVDNEAFEQGSFTEKIGAGFRTIGLIAFSYTLLNIIFSFGEWMIEELGRTGLSEAIKDRVSAFTVPYVY